MINKRRILLTPEIGDWTQFVPGDQVKDIAIGTVGVSSFDRLTKDDLIKAHKLHYRGFEDIVRNLTEVLKIKTDLYSLEINQTVYSNYKKILGEGFLQIGILVQSKFTFYIYMQNSIANILIDRALGGRGESSSETISKVEQKVLEKVVEQVLKPFLGFWDINQSLIEVFEVQSTTQVDLRLNPQSAFVMLSGKVGVGSNSPGIISFGYGGEAIMELLDRYDRNAYRFLRQNVELMSKTKNRIKMKFNVEIGSTELTMNELMSLSEGDIIKLDKPINRYIKGKLADTVTLNCFPGVSNDRFSIKVMGHTGNLEYEDETSIAESGIVLIPYKAATISDAKSPESLGSGAEGDDSPSISSIDAVPVVEAVSKNIPENEGQSVDEGFAWNVLGEDESNENI